MYRVMSMVALMGITLLLGAGLTVAAIYNAGTPQDVVDAHMMSLKRLEQKDVTSVDPQASYIERVRSRQE